MDQETVNKVAMLVRKNAEERASNAAYSGDWGDGGAGALRDKLNCWMAGIEGRVPHVFQAYLDKQDAIERKDRAEYARLKAKFGDQ